MKKIKLIAFLVSLSLIISSCVDQSGATAKAEQPQGEVRIVACSMATAIILDKLDVELVGIVNSAVAETPERYQGLPTIGNSMSPDIEIIRSLKPDYALAPVSLIADYLPKFEAAEINYGFINLNNVEGMYKSIADLGQLLDREAEANALVKEYQDFMADYRRRHQDKKSKKVLILMGLPGSYVIATENSYVGSLVALAGAENVYAGSDQQFLAVNAEDLIAKKPDLILRTAHAVPEEVMQMFKEDFAQNDIWKHFDCVQAGEVYDLDYHKFGMSASFNYPEALADLEKILYD